MRVEGSGPKSRNVWLTKEEIDLFLDQYDIGSRYWIAMSLFARCGLKSKEVVKISPSNIVQDRSPKLLELESSGHQSRMRRVPIPDALAASINASVNKVSLSELDANSKQECPAVNVATRTLRTYTKRHAEKLEEITGDEGWHYLSARSLRHSWADILLSEGISPEIVMRWGGWRNPMNFHELYISSDRKSDYEQIYETSVFTSKKPHHPESFDSKVDEYDESEKELSLEDF